MFLQIGQKWALVASVVHAHSIYTAKLVQINVLLPENFDETTLDDLIADQNRGLADELPLNVPTKIRRQYLNCMLFVYKNSVLQY